MTTMANRSSAYSSTNAQDGGGSAGVLNIDGIVSEMSPGGINQGGLRKFLKPGEAACGAEVSYVGAEAVQRAAAAGVTQHTSMAELAARKAYSSPTSVTPGAPAPSAPAVTTAAPAQRPVTHAKQVQMQQTTQETLSQQLERAGAPSIVQQNMRKITFSIVREANLHGLASGDEKPHKSYTLMTPSAGERAVVTGVRVTRISSSCPQTVGVCFGDLTPKFVAARPDNARGGEYHVAAPRANMPAETDEKEVFRMGTMANPQHLINYGGIKNIDDVEKEIEPSQTGQHNVFLDGTVLGGIILKNNPSIPLRKSEDGRFFVTMKRAKLDEYKAEVQRLLDSPEFQRCLTDLSNFNMTLVPLNAEGKWDDVPEWRHLNSQEQQKQKREMLKSPFVVHVEGEMDIMLLKKQK